MPNHTRTIQLTQGKYALVDSADYEYLSQWKWHVRTNGKHWYAARSTRQKGKLVFVHMHRLIVGAPDGLSVDHVDGDGLNNVRANLRLATHRENGCNSGLPKNNTSGYKGVSWYKRDRKWRAQISANGKRLTLGLFDDKEEAARAYDEAAREHFGEFAQLNFPSEGD